MSLPSRSLQRDPLILTESSVSGRPWIMTDTDSRLVLTLMQRWNVPEIIAKILVDRGLSLEEVEDFLTPTLRRLMPDPSHLKDMDQAVDLVFQALQNNSSIAVFGDYDVDGATSSSLLMRFLKAVGCHPHLYIPDRFKEGYGPNCKAFQTLHQKGISLIITVDCGTMAFEPIQEARNLGMKVIVIDHHAPQLQLPPAHALINPHRLDDPSPLKNLAAVGLTFLFLVALNRKLRQENWYTPQRPEPDLYSFLDLVALGTVCDVVPLKGLNRAYVSQGLKVLHQRKNVGLAALSDQVSLAETPSAYHLGYVYGPRINAGGRVALPFLGSLLLSTEDPLEAAELASTLDQHNQERRLLEAEVLEQAITQAEKSTDSFLLLAGEGWHHGIIGIVASRIKEKFHKPCCIVGIDGAGIGKGSGRSVSPLHLGNLIHRALQEGLLLAGGGHAMAAGFSLKAENIEGFRHFLKIHSEELLSSYRPTLSIDGLLTPRGAHLDFTKMLQTIGPFGMGNPTPRFVLSHIQVAHCQEVGKNHLRLILRGEDGSSLKAMAFQAGGTSLGDRLQSKSSRPFQVAGTLSINSWRDQDSVVLHIEDAAEIPQKEPLLKAL